MSVESDDIVHAHAYQFLKRESAVQGFTAASLVLAAFVKERHDHVKAPALASDGGNDSFQILKVIVRGHVVCVSGQRIGQAVVADIYHKINIFSAYGFSDDTLGFSGSEAGNLCVDQIIISFIPAENDVVFVDMSVLSSPFHQIIVYPVSHFLAPVKGNDPKCSNGNVFQVSFSAAQHKLQYLLKLYSVHQFFLYANIVTGQSKNGIRTGNS